jgi:hypothetical protein
MYRSSSVQDADPDKGNVNFDQYPSWKYQNHYFSKFNTLYDKIKAEIISKDQANPKISIPEYSSLEGSILGKNISKTEYLYNKLIESLQNYIKYLNKAILYIANKKKTGTQIDKKGNPLLIQQFIKIRKYQPECKSESYKIPSFFTQVTLPSISNTNSISVNKQIISEINICIAYLKSIIEQTFKNALNPINYDLYK